MHVPKNLSYIPREELVHVAKDIIIEAKQNNHNKAYANGSQML